MRQILTLTILWAIFSTSIIATAQTRCPEGRDDEVPVPCGVLADQADALDEAHASTRSCQRELDDTTGRLNSRIEDLNRCEADNRALLLTLGQMQAVEPVRRSPWWLRSGLVIAAPIAAAAGGVCAGRCPDEVTVGVLVGSAALLVGRLVLQLVDDSR